MRKFILLSAMLLCVICGTHVLAASDEIQVYTEEMNNPGQFGLEQHLNHVIKGQKIPEYPGQMVAHHVTQITPEFSYGLTRSLEAGLYVPFAINPAGDTFLNGLRLRLKYIAPRQRDENLFYGLNVEIGRAPLRASDSISSLELRPILGYRDARWLLSFNPILNMGLAANVSHQPQFEPALKVTHLMHDQVHGGIEYYGSYGSLNKMLPSNQCGHTIYAVFDVETRSFDINFGIGRGFVNAADTWVAKAIIALPLM